MRDNYTLPRLYLDAPLSEGGEIDLPKEQAHYLATVIRKSVGDHVRIFNGEHGEWQAEIASASKRAVTLRLQEQLRKPNSVPDIMLAFAPVRKHRTTFIIEKATELGVKKILPVITARTQFPKFNVDKARLQAIEAAEQTERLDVPQIFSPLKLDEWISRLEGRLIFADEALASQHQEGSSAIKALKNIKLPAAILIGPEGGFTDQEREMIRAYDNVIPVSLGPRILRADTAALSLLTLFQAVCGDWQTQK